MAHAVIGAVLVSALRLAPVGQQPLPESSLDLIGYEAPRGDIIEKDAGGETARAAGADATHLAQGAIRRVSVRTTPPPATLADLRPPASARMEAALQTVQNLGSVDPSESAAAELKTDSEILDARGPDTGPVVTANLVPGRQTLTAANTDHVPLSQTFLTETPLPSSPALPDHLAPIASPEAAATPLAPESRRLPEDPLEPERSSVIEPFEIKLDAPPAKSFRVAVSEPVGEDAAMHSPPDSATLASGSISTNRASAATLQSSTLTASATSGLDLLAKTEVGLSAPPEAVPNTPVLGRNPVSAKLPASAAPYAVMVGTAAPPGPSVAAGRPASLDAPERTPPAIGAPAGVPDPLFLTAGLAWSGTGEERFDPVSLAAIQSFVNEEDLRRSEVGTLRDGIADLLARVPCARLQVAFDPETGTLALRGHVPEAGLRGPVAEALRAQVGGSIQVVDHLQILPRPQCGALAGMEAAGLPQSTDQETDPRLIGDDSYSMIYRYVEGDRLILDVTAPDYDAWVYVDYFDASGMVVHLVPNENVSLERHAAKSAITVGADRADGNFMAVTVGPPYGQEIAVAFATSAPLYETARATVERAAPYLDWLRSRIAEARAANPGFKGEWVYFFVASSEE